LAICLNRKCVYTNLYYLFENHLFQDDYLEALSKLNLTVTKAYAVNPNIKFEVFIHKVDGLSDDTKMETQRDIHQRATDELAENELETQIHLTFYLVTPSSIEH
jgi:Ras-related GTP-binding protein C/D